jgi:hypothetical protein
MPDTLNSGFGKGFTYCIGLFLTHAERKEMEGHYLWFNGAADHLFELEIPENFILRDECGDWRDKCINWRLEKYTEKDKTWAIKQAKRFLLEWDKQNNIPCKEGEWE